MPIEFFRPVPSGENVLMPKPVPVRCFLSSPGEAACLVGFGDPHVSVRPPASRGPGYFDEINGCFAQVDRYAEACRSGVLLCPGDWFHRKAASTHADVSGLVEALVSLVSARGCPVLSVPGNHDMVGDNRKTVMRSQPLGVLVRAGLVHLVDTRPVVLGFPGFSVGVAGAGYASRLDDALKAMLQSAGHLWTGFDALSGCPGGPPYISHLVVLLHADLTYDSAGVDDFASRFVSKAFSGSASSARSRVRTLTFVNGHIHDCRGSMALPGASALLATRQASSSQRVSSSQSVRFVNLGALARVATNEREAPLVGSFAFSSGSAVSLAPLSVPDDPSSFLDCLDADTEAPGGSEHLDRFADMLRASGSAGDENPAEWVRSAAVAAGVPSEHVEAALRLLAEVS